MYILPFYFFQMENNQLKALGACARILLDGVIPTEELFGELIAKNIFPDGVIETIRVRSVLFVSYARWDLFFCFVR